MKHNISEAKLPLSSDETISEITLSNGQLTIVVHNFGARLHKIFAPDRHGTFENILLAKDNSETYKTDGGYYGLICGPVAGRIAGAQYDDVKLEANEGRNLLHSGDKGWERQFWSYETFVSADSIGITLSLKDKSSGFPGPIDATVTYKLTGNKLTVEMTGYADVDTVFNPAFHPYFNLSADKETTLHHQLQVNADRVVEADEENIPTGRLLNVDGTVYVLRESVSIASILDRQPNGFDNCFVFPEGEAEKSLTLYDPASGRKLSALTDRQSVVIYTATNPETASVINGRPMSPNRGIAIEFQELPDMVHHPEWGSIKLKAGEMKRFNSEYLFTAE